MFAFIAYLLVEDEVQIHRICGVADPGPTDDGNGHKCFIKNHEDEGHRLKEMSICGCKEENCNDF